MNAIAIPSLAPMAAPDEPEALPLYDSDRGSEAAEHWNLLSGQPIVRNVTRPTLTPVLPDPDVATGAAVVIAPGGGFQFLSMDSEGWLVARWLAERGIAAFVLKYRLNETPADDGTFGQELLTSVARLQSEDFIDGTVAEPRATLDASAAILIVRENATAWGIDPDRVGALGFSAGAITVLNAVLEAPSGACPSFLGYIYGPMTKTSVPAGMPPMFAALAFDDQLFGRQGLGLAEAWRGSGAPVELHVYEKGGHGFGMGLAGTTCTGMMDQFVLWLQARGYLPARDSGSSRNMAGADR